MWGEQLFCVSVLTVILGIGVSWHFILMPLMLWDIAQFLLIWNFCAVPILETFSSCSLPPLSSLMLTNLSSLTSLAAYSESWTSRSDDRPTVDFSCDSTYVWFRFDFDGVFGLFPGLYLYYPIPLWITKFCEKCYLGLSLGYKEVTQLHALLSVHKLNSRCTVNHQGALRDLSGLWSQSTCYLLRDLHIEELGAKWVLNTFTHS